MAAIHFLLGIFLLLLVCSAIGLVWLLREMGCAERCLPITADWISELSAERYRPMLRLLDTDELDLLKSQPHFTAGQESQFRSNRAQIFRGYLRCLHADFLRISMAIRVLMVQSRDDRPDLARVLIRRRTVYAAAAAAVHLRLFLYERGVCGVDATGLMRTFEEMRRELRSLLPDRVMA
ncbi:MAG TPA: hypothetical protein VKT49_15165 [Bryobacteraceae bacterium]|nr:hypothetical protein [Bryobacteraceae bacterium]